MDSSNKKNISSVFQGENWPTKLNPQSQYSRNILYTCNQHNDDSNVQYQYITIKISLYQDRQRQDYTLRYIVFCPVQDVYQFDFSPLLLFVLAVLIVAVIARSRMFSREQGSVQVSSSSAVIWVIFASVALMFLFFFINFNIVMTILRVIVCLISTVAVMFVINEMCFNRILEYFGCQRRYEWKHCCTKNFCCDSLSEYLSLILGIALVITYFVSSHWVLNNILAFALCYMIIKTILLNSWKTATILTVLGFVYDVFWVFISPYLFGGESVMAVVAMSLNIPALFESPHFSDTLPPSCSKLGLGDLIFPGICISFLYRFDLARLKRGETAGCKNGYYWSGVTAYILSLIFCMIGLYGMQMAQPVLFYIVPLFHAIIWGLACKRHEAKMIWKGEGVSQIEQAHPSSLQQQNDDDYNRISSNGQERNRSFEMNSYPKQEQWDI